MKNECYKAGKAHKMEARFEEVEIGSRVEFKNLYYMTAEEFRRLLVREKYVKDICVRCGKSVKRED